MANDDAAAEYGDSVFSDNDTAESDSEVEMVASHAVSLLTIAHPEKAMSTWNDTSRESTLLQLYTVWRMHITLALTRSMLPDRDAPNWPRKLLKALAKLCVYGGHDKIDDLLLEKLEESGRSGRKLRTSDVYAVIEDLERAEVEPARFVDGHIVWPQATNDSEVEE